jgi:glycosyltransferase involved in cell wall biosynthesis
VSDRVAGAQSTVDIMLPAFGDDGFIRETVASVRAQTDQHWRLTVIDDGPAAGRDPGLADWLEGHGDPKIRYLRNPERLGINRNFQRCVDESAHELVVLLGADDRLLPDFVARVRAVAAENPFAAFVHTGASVINIEGEPVDPLVDRVKRATSIRPRRGQATVRVGGQRLSASLLRGNWMYFPSVVFRRDWLIAHGFQPGYEVVQDLDLYLRILRDGGRAVLLGEPGIEYRRHAASVSSEQAQDGSRFAEERRFFAEAAAAMDEIGWSRAARAARLHLTSRLHALVKVAPVARAGQVVPALKLLRTVISPLPKVVFPLVGSGNTPSVIDSPVRPHTEPTPSPVVTTGVRAVDARVEGAHRR